MMSIGVAYRVHPPEKAPTPGSRSRPQDFSPVLIEGSVTSAAFGDGFNRIMAPILGGRDEGCTGVAVDYQRNLFHTASLFSLDWGAKPGLPLEPRAT